MKGGWPPCAAKLAVFATHRAGFKRQPATPAANLVEGTAVFQNGTVCVFCMPVSFCGRGKAERFVKAAGGTCCISMRQGEPLFSRIRGSSQLRLSLSGRHRQQDSSSTAHRDIPFPDEARQRPPTQFFRPTQKKTYFQGLCSRVSSRPTDEARKSSAHKAPCF